MSDFDGNHDGGAEADVDPGTPFAPPGLAPGGFQFDPPDTDTMEDPTSQLQAPADDRDAEYPTSQLQAPADDRDGEYPTSQLQAPADDRDAEYPTSQLQAPAANGRIPTATGTGDGRSPTAIGGGGDPDDAQEWAVDVQGNDADCMLVFDLDRGSLTVNPGHGGDPYTLPAASGKKGTDAMNNRSAVGEKDRGPLPPGIYEVDMSQMSNPSGLRDWVRNEFHADWGDWRVPLVPILVPGLGTRDGFKLHGGDGLGTAGCIDIGGGRYGNDTTNRVFGDLTAYPGERVLLLVR
jgi:hypothetical protein